MTFISTVWSYRYFNLGQVIVLFWFVNIVAVLKFQRPVKEAYIRKAQTHIKPDKWLVYLWNNLVMVVLPGNGCLTCKLPAD